MSKPGQKRTPDSRRLIDVLRRPAVGLPVAAAVLALVVAGVVVVASGGDGPKRAGSAHPDGLSSTTTAGPADPTNPAGSGPTGSTAPGTVPGTGTTTRTSPTATTTPTRPADPAASAPWQASAVARSAVPAPFLEAWQRAKNRSKCALLVPSGTPPRMDRATASFDATPDDRGWDILLRQEAGIIEILGLFSRTDQPEDRAPASFTRRWSDGSEVRYGPEAGGGPEVSPDPEANAFEGVLVIPTQDCAYRIYDTLGLSHFEFVLDHLRFAEGAGAP